jgi:diguanylate cyclase (GGDEF)-like protein
MEVDQLTGVGSRAWFERVLAVECRQADAVAAPLSLVCVDIDRFGEFATRHTQQVVELELVRVARTLQRAVWPEEHLARVGDDEFAILLPNTDAAQAAETAERCRAAVALDGARDGQLALTVSIGFVTAWRRRITGLQLLEAAHVALAEAKSGGRNLVAMYRPRTSA